MTSTEIVWRTSCGFAELSWGQCRPAEPQLSLLSLSLSLSGNRLLVCAAPRAHGPLGRDVFPGLLRAHADGEILQQPRAFQLPRESARNGNAALGTNTIPSSRSSSPGLQAISACAFCFTRGSCRPVCVCRSGSSRAGTGALGAGQHLFRSALGHPRRLSPLLRLLPCLCAAKILPPGASAGSLSNYTPPLPMLAVKLNSFLEG